nr:hypothetical protein [Tanacetum cinerariifolium]
MKRTRRDRNGRVVILPPTTAEEHIAVQRESKARTTLLQSLPDDHMRKSMLKQEFSEFRIGEAEGLHKGYDRMQKILSQLNQLKAKPEDEDINLNATIASKKMPYGDSPSYSSTNTYFVPSNSKTGPHRFDRKIRPGRDGLEMEMAMLSVRVHKFEQKTERKIDFDKKESARFNKKKVRCYKCQQRGHFARECRGKGGNDKQRYSLFKIKEIGKKEEDSKALITVDTLVDWTDHDNESNGVIAAKEFGMIAGCDSKDAIEEGAAKIYNLITGADSEEANKIRVLSIELENTSNLLKHSEKINADVETAKKDLQTKLDNHLVQTEKWRNSSKNLFRLIDSSMSIRTKVGLGFNDRIRENELGWDDSTFSVFTTNSEDVEDNIDMDESQMSYGTKSSTFCDSKSVSNDFVSCDDSDKSSEVNSNDFASSDSSVKSSEPKPNDSTSCASTSSVSTFVNKAEIESNVGTPIKEPIIVQDLPRKMLHLSKLCFVCGSGTHLIKDYDFYEKQMANKTVGIRVGYVHSKNKVNHQNQFVPQAVLLRTGKINIPPARPKPVSTGWPNRPFPVPTDTRYSPSVSSDWLKSAAKSMPHFSRPTSSYFQTYTSYVPTMSYTHMKYGRDRWATAVKPLPGCSWKSHRKAAEDEGIFDSGCSRSMTGNKERLDDFHKFKGGKVTFRGGKGRITRKGTIQTPSLDFENVYYVKEMQQFNLFSISQICDKKNQVLFTDTECLVLSTNFKLPDKSMVVLRVPRKHNLYTINLNNLCPREYKDETYHTLKDFINLVENQLNKKVKAIRCDNGTKFKNALMISLCGSKGIKREYSNVRTPQQNRVAERKNRTLVEAARTMLADSKLPTMFWTEATPYALLTGNIPFVSHFKPCGCHVTILNTSDHLGKFDGKADEGYIVGYSASNKAYRVYNVPNKMVEESMNLRNLKDKPNVQGLGAATNPAGTQHADSDSNYDEQVIIVPSYPSHSIQRSKPKDTSGDEVDDTPLYSADEIFQKELARLKVPPGCIPVPTGNVLVPPGSLLVPTSSIPLPTGNTVVSTDDVPIHTSSSTDSFFDDEPTTRFPSPSDLGNHDPSPGIFSSSSYDDEFGAALNNVASTVEFSPVATTRINTIHPQSLIIGDPTSAMQTRSKALKDPSWVDAMQEEMQQFKFQNVWVLVDLPKDKYAIGTKWILKNKRDDRGTVVQNKARLVAQDHRQEEGIDYDEVFAPVARIEAIRLFLAFSSYMGFMVYQMDIKSAFIYGRINEEVYVTQPKGFVDPQHPKKVYKVVKALYGLHQAPRGTIDKTLFFKKNYRDIILIQVYMDDIIFGSTKKAWCDEFEALMKGEFQMSVMEELTFFLGLQVYQRPDGISINQDKYVQEILNKFDLGSVKMTTTPYEATKPKSKNESNSPVNVHLYRSMIGSLMYLTASRPDIMFAVSACSRNQVTPITSNLEAVKKIFMYLKGQPKLGLWYPKESPLVLEAYSDSDYTGANKDRKSTIGGCQFLGRRLISWQCKKQTIMATSSTEAGYVAAANCFGQPNGSRWWIRDF